ncbi:MAG: hypothetical protein WCI39_06670 [Gallionellaceae bacterium]
MLDFKVNIFNLFRKKQQPRKSEAAWAQTLLQMPDWQLENIINNPGEFVVEMRQTAATILRKRNGT